jgi:hypothetical protein
VVTLIVVGAVAGLSQITSRGVVQTQQKGQSQSAIDSDISEIKTLANQFHCCATACTSNSSVCSGATAGSSLGTTAFFKPVSGSTAETRLNAACNSRSIASTLRNEILARADLAITPAIDIDSVDAHRLKVTYSAAGNTERVAYIVPTVAAFCPDT